LARSSGVEPGEPRAFGCTDQKWQVIPQLLRHLQDVLDGVAHLAGMLVDDDACCDLAAAQELEELVLELPVFRSLLPHPPAGLLGNGRMVPRRS